jgi:type IV pilus assembly protein PilB
VSFSPTPLPPAGKKRRLGEILRDAGVIDDVQLSAALAEQKKWGGKLGRTLVEMGFVDEDSIARALSRQLGLPLVDLDRATLSPELPKQLRLDIAERYGVFPIGGDRKHKVLHIATSDPTNSDALQELSFATGMSIQTSLASATSIERAIRRLYYGERTVAVSTTTPDALGISEATYELQVGAGGPAPSMEQRRPDANLEQRVSQLTTQLETLQGLVSNQVYALRGLMELLAEKGLVQRDEYLAKIRGARGKG